MDWRTTYPTVAAVSEASFETLCTWCDHLPAPQTDVERTVRRRLFARRDELLACGVRKKAPELADRLNRLTEQLEAIGIRSPFRRM